MASEISETSHSDIDPNTQALHQPHHEFHGYIPQQTPMPALSQPPTMTTVIPPIPTAPESSQMASPYGLQHPPLGVQGQPIEQESTGGGTSTILAVTNLPYRIRWQDLKDLFRRYGTPSRADVFLAPDGRSRGVGMVTMRTRREAENCVNDLNGYEWYGRKIGVRIDETGGHHALAAAAMAGATIWDGVGIQQDYEVCKPLGHYFGMTLVVFPFSFSNPFISRCQDTPVHMTLQVCGGFLTRGYFGSFSVDSFFRTSGIFLCLTNRWCLIGRFPAIARLPRRRRHRKPLSFAIGQSNAVCRKRKHSSHFMSIN